MVTVPVSRGNRVDASPRPVGAVQPVRNPVGEAIGEGLRDLGRAGQGYAETQDRINDEFDQTGAKTLLLGLQGEARDPLVNYFNSEGFDAMSGSVGLKKQIADLRSSYAAKATTPRMRRYFEQSAAAIETEYLGKISDHSIGALKQQQITVAKGEQSQYQSNALLNWADPKLFNDNLAAGLAAVEAEAKVHGVTGVPLELAKRKYVSGTRKSVVSQLLAENKQDDAIGYATVHRGDFDADDMLDISKVLREPLELRQGIQDFARVRGSAPEPNAQPGTGETLSSSALFSHGIVPIEGGTGKRGEFLISPKGAVGPAQVMPGTAPEAAKLAGLPWDEKRYRGDKDYNLALGNAYYKKQLSDFGDPIVAAAAYNAGPGNVRAALAKAKKSGGNWQDYLPGETKAYIAKFADRVGASAGAVPYDRVDEADIYGRLNALAENEGWSPERKRVAEAEADRYVNRQRSLISSRENDAKDAALEWVVANGDTFTSTAAVPRQIWDNLSPEMQVSLQGRAQSNGTSQAVKPNSTKAMELSALIYGNPDQFLKTDLGAYVGQVTAAELSSAVEQQAKMRGPSGDKTIAMRSAISTAIGTYTDRDPAMSKLLDKKKDPEAFARVAKSMEAYLASTLGGKREPTGQEMDAAWRQAVMPVATHGGWFGGSKTVPRFKADGRYQVAVPFAVRERIIRSWRSSHGGQMPPDGVIGDIYVQNRGKKGYWE